MLLFSMAPLEMVFFSTVTLVQLHSLPKAQMDLLSLLMMVSAPVILALPLTPLAIFLLEMVLLEEDLVEEVEEEEEDLEEPLLDKEVLTS